jgi:hypothetical protein
MTINEKIDAINMIKYNKESRKQGEILFNKAKKLFEVTNG